MSSEPSEAASGAKSAAASVRALQALLTVFLMLALIIGLHGYLGLRLLSDTALPAGLQVAGWLLLAFLFLSIPLSLFLRRKAPGPASRALSRLAYGWLGTFGILLPTFLAAELVRAAASWTRGPQSPEARVEMARMLAIAVVLTVSVLVVLALRSAAGNAKVERVEVPLPQLGEGMQGLRIVQVSDVHIGEDGLDRRFLERMVDHVNALKPDVIAITGDLVEGTVEELHDELLPLSRLQAPLGVFFVTGNHEYYWNGPAWEAKVQSLGLTVLHNEHRVLERGGSQLVVGGVTDFSGGQFAAGHASRPDLAFAHAPAGVPRVLLAHQPRSAQAAALAGVDLQLSGHTHGGQIFPFNFFVRLQQPVVQGLKRLFGIWVYTHRGTGYWGPPMRLGARPEIAELRLIQGLPR